MPKADMAISPVRCNRQVIRSTSGPGRGALCGRLLPLAVVGQENLFEAGFVARQVDDLARGDRPHQRSECALDGAADLVAMNLDVVDSCSGANGLDRRLTC